MTSIPEQRFKESSGTQFQPNGNVRCHALAKSKMRAWREAYNDYDTPTELLWPECQCEQTAEEGQFVCRFHGGLTPRTVNPPRTMLDALPLDMIGKYRAVMESPDYISRKEDINLIQVRVRMLLEDLSKEADSEEAWGLVHEAIVKLRQGDSVNALEYLEHAVKTTDNKQKVWKEIYQTEKLLGDLTTTQMKTAKDLQSMATAEQVNALISTLLNAVIAGASDYISDPVSRSRFNNHIVAEVQQLMGTSPRQVILDHAKFAD